MWLEILTTKLIRVLIFPRNFFTVVMPLTFVDAFQMIELDSTFALEQCTQRSRFELVDPTKVLEYRAILSMVYLLQNLFLLSFVHPTNVKCGHKLLDREMQKVEVLLYTSTEA